jgi:hypothetical protein
VFVLASRLGVMPKHRPASAGRKPTGLLKPPPTKAENNNRCFEQKTLKTLSACSLLKWHLGTVSRVCKLRLRPADAGQTIGTSGRLRQNKHRVLCKICLKRLCQNHDWEMSNHAHHKNHSGITVQTTKNPPLGGFRFCSIMYDR